VEEKMGESPEGHIGYKKVRKKGRQRRRVNIWFGFEFSAWMRVLFENRFQVAGRKMPLAIAITVNSLTNTLLRWLECVIYGRKVDRTEIKKFPVFIIGHWRCGTTLLHELLGLDERHTYPTTYECFNPNHFLLTERLFGPSWRLLLPARRPMDNMAVTVDRPQEDEFALCNLGVSSPYLTIVFPNGPLMYVDYFDLERLTPRALQQWKRTFVYFLKRITSVRPKRIILKSPVHTFRIKVLLKLFPQARFVHIVRDPYITFPSTVHMWRSLFRAFALQTQDFVGLEDYVFEMFNRLHEKLEETRGLIPPSQLYELRYEDLITDPIGEIGKLYRYLGLGEFESVLPALKKYLANVAHYQTNIYELTPKMRAEITRHWGKIIKKYGYPVVNEHSVE